MKLGAGRIGLAALGLAMALPPAAASAEEGDGWRFNLVPHVWMPGIEGTLSHGRLPIRVGVSQDFGDVLDRLDVGGMVAFEGHRGRWGFLLDGLYVQLSDTGAITAARVPVETRSRTFTGLAALQYRLVDEPGGTLDLLAGARHWSVETRLAATIPGLPPPLPPLPPGRYEGTEKANWTDAMGGAKAVVRLNRTVSLNAHAMFGGGGSGFSSDALLGAGFRLGGTVSLLAGWRHMSTSYRGDRGFRFDANLSGPALGAGIRL